MTGRTIAVLPFLNISPDKDLEYFSDGITEEIINALAQIDGLRVISRTSSFSFKSKDIPLKEIAGTLGVANVLEGSVRMSGGRVRITAQLIQAADDFHFWSETWDRNLNDIFAVQDESSLLIAEKLREQTGHFEIGEHLVRKQTGNLEAYHRMLRGRYHVHLWNPVDAQRAIDLFHQALEKDPQHVESYVGLAEAYSFMASTETLPREETWALHAKHTCIAHDLNPDHPAVHHQLANLAFFTRGDFREAVRHNARSLELKANYPNALHYRALLHLLGGDPSEAGRCVQRALDIDPLNPESQFYQAYFHYRTHRFEEALNLYEALLQKNPRNIPASIVRNYCLLKLQRPGEALSSLEAMPDEIALPDEWLGIRCLAGLPLGNNVESAACLRELEAKAKDPQAFQAHSYLYLVYANRGEATKAFEWLEKAMAVNSSVLLISFSDPLAEALRSDPRYAAYQQRLYGDVLLRTATPPDKAPPMEQGEAENSLRRLGRLMREEEAFLNPTLSLRELAGRVDIHPNQLSWLLNTHAKCNFNEFVNRHRVEHFKKLARNPDLGHLSLVGLAFESGFNSKTVFNTCFKRETGMTPVSSFNVEHPGSEF
ncbi:MAG: helix-turn-helix domain-containing protein [Bacteroidales bacterium]